LQDRDRGQREPDGERDRARGGGEAPAPGRDSIVVYVPADELGKLLGSDKVSHRMIVRYTLGATSGSREGELQGLQWADLKLEAKIPSMQIDRQVSTKGRKLIPPKKGSYRTLPLHAAAVRALSWWKSEGWEQWTGRKLQPGDPVFPDQAGEHFRPHTARDLRMDLLRAGCSDECEGHKIDAHALRRSFGTCLADNETPIEICKALMGHGAQGVTDRHYLARIRWPPRARRRARSTSNS
jgi:integrase